MDLKNITMTQINIFLSDEENLKAFALKQKWKLSKHDAVRKIIRDFKEETKQGDNK